MERLIVSARRVIWLVVLGAAAATAYTWWRDRNPKIAPIDPPEWPPLKPLPTDSTAAAPERISAGAVAPGDIAPRAADSGPTAGDPVPSAASFVNALVDTPDARSTTDDGTWVPPNEDGSCPDGYPIKANDNSGIYHRPDGRFYDRTNPERCYATSAAAEADGYRAAKS